MSWPTIRYRVGNENNPSDPWGRSELVIYSDGSARLDHHFSPGGRPPRAWAGYVDAAAMDELVAALDRAGFPPFPLAAAAVPDSTSRQLAVETDGIVRRGGLDWEKSELPPDYAAAFDLIDAVIRQLSADAVTYPTQRGPVVHGAFALVPGA